MQRNIEYGGKRYPRYWGDDQVSLSEAMDRMGAKKYMIGYKNRGDDMLTIHANLTDVHEGVEFYGVSAHNIQWGDPDYPAVYIVRKTHIDQWLVEHGRPRCDDPDPLTEAESKEKIAAKLKVAAAAATFALEQVKDEPEDEINKELRMHWRSQEHSYLVALTEAETARTEVNKLIRK